MTDELEYTVNLDDTTVTRKEIITEINAHIKKNQSLARTPKGIEILVPDEWSELLLKDGSIIRGYEKVGWKVRWFQIHSEGPAKGLLVKSWLQFWSNDYAKQVR